MTAPAGPVQPPKLTWAQAIAESQAAVADIEAKRAALAEREAAAQPSADTAQYVIEGMRAVPSKGEPWSTRLAAGTEHPPEVARAAGALVTVTSTNAQAFMCAYLLYDAGMLRPYEPPAAVDTAPTVCGEVGTGWPNGSYSDPVDTEPCALPWDHEEDHDWAQREAAASGEQGQR